MINQYPSPIPPCQSEMISLNRDTKSSAAHHIAPRFITQSIQKVSNQVFISPETILENSSNSSSSGTPKNQILCPKEYLTKLNTQAYQFELKEEASTKLEKYRLNYLTTKSTEKYPEQNKPFSSLNIPISNESELDSLGLRLNKKKTVVNEIEVQEDCKIYKNDRWSKTKLMMFESAMSFFEFSFNIVDLKKIKIMPSNATKMRIENIVKLQIQQQVSLISIATDKKHQNLPTSFYLFAKLISKKLYQEALPPGPCPKPSTVSTIKTNDSYIHGEIYKRSQHLGNWEKRYIIIKSDGIYSYKDSKQEEPHTFYINNQSVKYIWTRFHLIESHLIIKVKHGISKTEFGIPLGEFSEKSTGNWLYGFYRTMAGLRIN